MQFIERVASLADQVADLAEQELSMNARLFDLYGLTAEERALVARDAAR